MMSWRTAVALVATMAGVSAGTGLMMIGRPGSDQWHVVAKADLYSVGHIDAPTSHRKVCRAFGQQVVPAATREGQSGFAGMEPEFVALVGHAWDLSGYPPVVECDFSATRAEDLRGLEVSQKDGAFVGAAYVDYQGDWLPAEVDWND